MGGGKNVKIIEDFLFKMGNKTRKREIVSKTQVEIKM